MSKACDLVVQVWIWSDGLQLQDLGFAVWKFPFLVRSAAWCGLPGIPLETLSNTIGAPIYLTGTLVVFEENMKISHTVHSLLYMMKGLKLSKLIIENHGDSLQLRFSCRIQKNVRTMANKKMTPAPTSKKSADQSDKFPWKKKKSPSNKYRSEARKFLRISDSVFQQNENSADSDTAPTLGKQLKRHFSKGKRCTP